MADQLKGWVRRLTVGLMAHELRPTRVEARAGRGLHVLLYQQQDCLVHLGLTPTGDTPEAARRTAVTAVRTLGDRQPAGVGAAWLDEIFRSLEQVERLEGWAAFLAWAGDQPAVALARAAQTDEAVSSGSDLLVRITGRCNAGCAFCSARGILPDLVEGTFPVRQRLRRAREMGVCEVSFTGGEPTLVRALASYIRLAKQLGFERVGLQTNGLQLARPERVRRLREAGLDSIFLSLHSSDPRVHDRMLEVPGAHSRAVEAARVCLAAGMSVDVNVVLTSQTIAGAADCVGFLAERFDPPISKVCLSSCSPQGWARQRADLLPRLTVAAVQLERAIRVGLRQGLEVRIPGLCGLPMCLLPGRLEFFDEYHSEHPPRLADRVQPAGCRACVLRSRCSGFWKDYIELYGESEFAPLLVLPCADLPPG
jgi:MoaA/NifB/PqqE/SkfB family radical SAM enzyme